MSKKMIQYLIGLVILSFGVSLVIKANLGADPISILILGISGVTGLAFGNASQAFMLTVVLLVAIIDWRRLQIGTILHAVLGGIIIDFFIHMPYDFLTVYSRSFAFTIGVLTIAFGIALYVLAGVGEGATDAFMMVVHKRFDLKLDWTRIAMDAVFTLVGVLLGAQIGIGTLILITTTGPLIQFFMGQMAPKNNVLALS